MKLLPALTMSAALLLSGCASFPELDGKPTTALRAADFQKVQAPVWTLDFGNAGLRRMLAEADSRGLDAAAARARFRAADNALKQARLNSGVNYSSDASSNLETATLNAQVQFEPDLAGRFDSALRAAKLEHSASGIDLLMARQTLARAVTQGWIELAKARTEAARNTNDISIYEKAIDLVRIRRDAGEATSADLSNRKNGLAQMRAQVAAGAGRIALAEARLRALGVRTLPKSISLKTSRRPNVPKQANLAATQAVPAVCATWLRFHASDARRAETLANARPRVVVTSSLSATAKTIAGLLAGNIAAVTNTVRLEGNILDNGKSRNDLDSARLSVAQAEIEWLRARQQAEIAALEAINDRHNAETGLANALSAWKNANMDLERVRARQKAGFADALELTDAHRTLASAQRDVDRARAEAFRAATLAYIALPTPVPSCETSVVPTGKHS